eukprot:8555833-Pyramimonas_sp.AAC.1
MPQRLCSHAFPPPSIAFRGPVIANSTEGFNGTVHVRFPRPARRFVAPSGAPLEAPICGVRMRFSHTAQCFVAP